jgi:hypothetical protein
VSAVLTAACSCGRAVVVSCPTLEATDWSAAHAAIEAAGFGWHEGLGYRCPDFPACSPVPPAPVPPPPRQASLFPIEAA